ncbi:hypothetical protein D3C74_462480 [compost metagenome]
MQLADQQEGRNQSPAEVHRNNAQNHVGFTANQLRFAHSVSEDSRSSNGNQRAGDSSQDRDHKSVNQTAVLKDHPVILQ